MFSTICLLIYIVRHVSPGQGNPVNGNCPANWERHGDSCYYVSSDTKSWYDAYGTCISRGGHLASIETKNENSILKALAQRKGGSYYWIDLSDHGIEGKWVSFRRQCPLYTDWYSGQPQRNTAQNCALLYRSYSYKLYADRCSYSRYYICEYDLGDSAKECAGTKYLLGEIISCKKILSSDCNCATLKCDSGKVFAGRCYTMSTDELTWSQALSACKSKNQHLVDITSKAENDMVKQMIKERSDHTWIGGADLAKEGDWRWDHTNDKLGFTDWYPGDPDGRTGQNCLIITYNLYNNQWIDNGCSTKHYYICESN